MGSKQILRILATALLITLSVSSCSALDFKFQSQSAQARAAINKVREKPLPDGYEISAILDGSYQWYFGNISANPNVSLQLKKRSTRPIADECKTIISFFISVGIKSFVTENPDDESARSPQAQIECVELLGSTPIDFNATGSVLYFGSIEVEGKVTELTGSVSRNTSTPDSDQIEWEYDVSIDTQIFNQETDPNLPSWEDAYAPDPLLLEFKAALNRIGEYRNRHPKAPLYSLKSVQAALAGFEKEHPQVKVTYDKSQSQIKRIQVGPADRSLSILCPVSISIKKYDSRFFGVPDPGTGYTVGHVEDGKVDDEFGQATSNC